MAEARKSLRALFDEVSEIDPGDARREFLEKACGADAALRAELEELLRAHETAGGFLADPKPDAADAAVVSWKEGDRIGRYKLLQKLGEGGCGVVYMAEQTEPVRRRVALKIIKLGMDTRSVIARFEAERQALALMDHANIARVLDAGTTDTGRPFFVMELVRGIKITDYCEKENLSTTARLNLFIQVCQAVQHAHQKGIIHRDLKPSNVLVTSNDGVPLPKVIDFGIAKATADVQLTDKTYFTRFEMFLGTPAYMSPEQAEFNASDVDTRTDIYSLGVLLYELLTGHPPFDTETWLKSGIDAMRKAIRETEPTRPSTRLTMELVAGATAPTASKGRPVTKELIQQLRGDLDWIVLKALEKDRMRRYETATALAADIRRHLSNEPVIARPPSPLYLFKKLVRRNRPAFALAGAVALLLVAGIIFSTWEAFRTRRAERVQRDLREKAEANQRQAEQARTEADAANRQLTRNLFHREWQDAENLLEQGKTASALAWFARAARERPADFAVQTRLLSILTENTFALPAGRPLTHGAPVTSAALSADERHLITATRDGAVHVWSLDSDAEALTFSNRFVRPSVAAVWPGNRVLVDDAESVSLWELTGGQVKLVPIKHRASSAVPVTRDGRFVALNCGDGGPQLWDANELRPVGRPVLEHDPGLGPAAVSPDGRYLFGFKNAYHLCAWEATSGRCVWQVHRPDKSRDWVSAVAVHPEGNRVVLCRTAGEVGGQVSLWEFEPGTVSDTEPRSPAAPLFTLPVRSRVTASTFSHDGERLFAGDLEGHFGSLHSDTRGMQILNAEHDGQVVWMALSADGKRMTTASVDSTARVWDVRMKPPPPQLFTNSPSVWYAKFSPDSRWFVMTGTGAAEIRDAASGALRHRLPLKGFITRVDVSSDGRRVVACDDTGASRVWDTRSGEPVIDTLEGSPADYVEFSRDGRWFLVVTSKETVTVHETETGRPVGPTLTNDTRAGSAHFSPDGRWLVASTIRGELEFWSLPDGRRLPRSARHKDVFWSTRFSPDGRHLLTASRDRTAVLWEAESGRLVREFRHDQQVLNAAFSPDGRRIVTGDAGRNTHVWDAETGQRLFTMAPHPGGVWFCEFSPDGHLLLTGDDAGNARLWEAQSGLPLSGWIRNGRSLKRTHLSPDGRRALSTSREGMVRLWSVMLAPQPAPAWLPDLAEAVAARRLREDATPEPVPIERWQALKASLASLTGDDFYARWARWFFVERMKDETPAFMP